MNIRALGMLARHVRGARLDSRVLGAGTANESTYLRGDGVWATPQVDGGVGGTVTATTVEPSLGSLWRTQGRFTITDASITSASAVLCWQAPGPYTGKGGRADEAAMQPVNVVAVEPASGSATVYWETPALISMQKAPEDGRRDAAGATFDRLTNQRPAPMDPVRLGRVRGNVKFSYIVFS